MTDNYEDIINLEHHKSQNYPWMPEADRAAQFAPFAALVGFEQIIEETARLHAQRLEQKHKSEFDE